MARVTSRRDINECTQEGVLKKILVYLNKFDVAFLRVRSRVR